MPATNCIDLQRKSENSQCLGQISVSRLRPVGATGAFAPVVGGKAAQRAAP